jgi:type II secretory pathway predicted ATPase ExeA
MMAEKKDGLNYISQLDLNRDPFSPEPDLTFYYEYESVENCSAVLNRLIQGDEIIVLVIGETGSGKTSLLKRYLTASIAGWKTGRIRIQPEARTEPDQPALFKDNEVDSYPAYFLQDIKDSIIIIDDAHELSSRHLTFMLKNAPLSNGGGNVKRFILFGEPQLIDAVNALTASLGNEAAISKIFVPPMTREQTMGYLNYRLAVAGYVGKRLLRASSVKKIHRLSGGLPGRINRMADQQLQADFTKKKQSQKDVFNWIHKHEKTLNWSAAGLAVLIIGLFVVFYYSSTQTPQPQHLTADQTVIRGKIDLPASFTKTAPLIIATLSSEKQNSTGSTLEKQTGHGAQMTSPVEEKVEIAATPQLSVATKPPETTAVAIESEIPFEKKDPQKDAVYREKWLLSQNSSFYTIQILGVHDESLLLRFIKSDLTATRTNLAYYQTSYKGKDWYPLLYGVFASPKEASSAIKKLPAHIQASSPWIRKLSSVQKAIQKQSKP